VLGRIAIGLRQQFSAAAQGQTDLAQRFDVDLGRMWRVVSAQRGDFVEGFSKPLWSAILAAFWCEWSIEGQRARSKRATQNSKSCDIPRANQDRPAFTGGPWSRRGRFLGLDED